MRPRLPSESVIDFRKGDEPAVQRDVVVGIRTLHPESAIHVHDQPCGVLIGDGPVDPNRGAEHDREAGPFALACWRGCREPEASTHHELRARATDVLAHGRRDTQVPERPCADADIDAAGIPEELDAQSYGADPAEGDPEPDSVALVRPLGRKRSREHRGKQEERGGRSGHGGRTAEIRGPFGAKHVDCPSRYRRSIEPAARRVYGRVALATFIFSALLAGCQPPDQPSSLELDVPSALLDWLEPDSARTVDLHPGVVYRYFWSPKGPWAVHLVQASMANRCDLAFLVLQAEGRQDGGAGRERVSSMTARSKQAVLAAINADFFTPEGMTVGAEVVDGVVRAVAERPTFAWRPGAGPWLGVAETTDSGLRFGWTVPLESGDTGTEAVGGFPDLIDQGERVGDLEVGARPSFAAARHPRSAVGVNSGSGQVWIVLVDGRQVPHSAGMTLPELAQLFEAAGTDEALNLDGGGSSAMVVGGAPVNRPSDATGERAVVNALALIKSPERCSGL